MFERFLLLSPEVFTDQALIYLVVSFLIRKFNSEKFCDTRVNYLHLSAFCAVLLQEKVLFIWLNSMQRAKLASQRL